MSVICFLNPQRASLPGLFFREARSPKVVLESWPFKDSKVGGGGAGARLGYSLSLTVLQRAVLLRFQQGSVSECLAACLDSCYSRMW